MDSSRLADRHTFFDQDRGDKPTRLADMTWLRCPGWDRNAAGDAGAVGTWSGRALRP